MGNPYFPPQYLPPNKVVLVPKGRQVEGQCGGAIPIASLCMLNSSGKYVVNNGYGTVSERLFAQERAWEPGVGAVTPKYLWDAYANNDWGFFYDCTAGAVVLALVALGENVSVGDKMASAGDGTLFSTTGTTTSTTSTTPPPVTYAPVGVALDAIDLRTTTTSTTLAAGQVAPTNTPFNTIRIRTL